MREYDDEQNPEDHGYVVSVGEVSHEEAIAIADTWVRTGIVDVYPREV